MTRRRSLSGDEEALWVGVTRSIKPLNPKQTSALPRTDAGERPPAKASASRRDVAPQPAPEKKAPPLAPLGRRLKQRVARGRDSIDARIDLHGFTQSEAHAALLRFLQGAQAGGARIVLVVTGKGTRGGDARERGVLKRQVPLWLALPQFRPLVVGFEDAHVGHGGEGALYVRLRRPR